MSPKVMNDCTRVLNKPSNWDKLTELPCGILPIVDSIESGLPYMISIWKPDEKELKLLNAGGVVRLGVQGSVHPVVFVDALASNVIKKTN